MERRGPTSTILSRWSDIKIICYNKVNRCLARHGPQSSRQGLAKNDQISQFRAKFGCFGAKILICTGESKSFGTNVREKPPTHLVCIVFLVGHGTNWAKNANIWPKMLILGQIWPFLCKQSNFLRAGSKTFGTLISGVQ